MDATPLPTDLQPAVNRAARKRAARSAVPTTFEIDLTRMMIPDLAVLEGMGDGSSTMRDVVDTLDRIVVGGVADVPVMQIGALVEAVMASIDAVKNPKDAAGGKLKLRVVAHLFAKDKMPWEYLELVLCRDVYHCPPSQLPDVPTILRHLTCMEAEAQVERLRSSRK